MWYTSPSARLIGHQQIVRSKRIYGWMVFILVFWDIGKNFFRHLSAPYYPMFQYIFLVKVNFGPWVPRTFHLQPQYYTCATVGHLFSTELPIMQCEFRTSSCN